MSAATDWGIEADGTTHRLDAMGDVSCRPSGKLTFVMLITGAAHTFAELPKTVDVARPRVRLELDECHECARIHRAIAEARVSGTFTR